jgi:hypothetical protein
LIVKENTLCRSKRAWYETAFATETEQQLLCDGV